MAGYKEIKGFQVQTRTEDPVPYAQALADNPYVGVWSSSGSMNTARDQLAADRRFGLEALGAQRAGGAEQRAIEQEGIAADYGQFREERDFPYKGLQFQQSLLQGLPIAAQTYSYSQPSTLSTILGSAGGIGEFIDLFRGGGGSEDKSYVDDMIDDAIAAGEGDT